MLALLLIIIVFFILSVLSFYIPGKLFIDALRLKEDSYAASILAWVNGIALFIVVSYLSAYLRLPYMTVVLLIICLFVFYRKEKNIDIAIQHHKKPAAAKMSIRTQIFDLIRGNDHWLSVIILTGSLSFLGITFFSGFKTQENLQFFNVNAIDGIIHLAYVKTQANVFPPQHPGLAGLPLQGYHYFYDFLLSRFVLLYNLRAEDLVFRLFPLFLSLLYGGTMLLLSRSFTDNKTALRLILFFAYFAQSTTSVLLFLNKDFDLLGINQPLLLILDPSIVLGLSLLFVALYLIPKIKENLGYAVVTGLLLGILAQIKVYTGVTGIAALACFLMYWAVVSRGKQMRNYLIALLIAGTGTVLTYGVNNFGYGSLVYAPLRFYEQYLQQDYLEFLHWEVITTIYREHHNILRIIQMFSGAIALVWFINLGLRLIVLLGIPSLFRKSFWRNPYAVLLLFTITVTIFIPSFFIQSRSVLDIVQFIWISLVLLCIPTGLIWAGLLNKAVWPLKVLLLLLLIAVCIPAYTALESLYIGARPALVFPDNELKVYNEVTKTVPKNAVVIVLPRAYENEGTITLKFNQQPITAALTGREMYHEGDITPVIDSKIIDKRRENIRRLVVATVLCDKADIKEAIAILGSRYVVSPDPVKCLARNDISEKKMESYTVSFYEIRNL